MDLSIVIPMYNEEKRIKNSILEINDFLKKNKLVKNYEIICIDDGSMDNTGEIVFDLKNEMKKELENVKINNKRKNKGKGFSVKQGIFMSNCQYVLFMDADLSTPISELDKFLKCLENEDFDILIASRNLKKSKAERTFFRKIIGISFSFLNNIILGLKYKDTQCGFKLFKRDVARKIFSLQRINGFAFDTEVLFLANKLNLRVKEIPVFWKESKSSTVNVLKDSFKMIKDVFLIRWRNYDIR